MALVQKSGIPAIDQLYIRRKVSIAKKFHSIYYILMELYCFEKDDPMTKKMGSHSYPTYHSSYETYEMIAKFVDPSFEV